MFTWYSGVLLKAAPDIRKEVEDKKLKKNQNKNY